jgi:hypothetical protein
LCDKETALATLATDKTIKDLNTRIDDLTKRLGIISDRLDKFFLAIVVLAGTSLVTTILMLAAILLGKI